MGFEGYMYHVKGWLSNDFDVVPKGVHHIAFYFSGRVHVGNHEATRSLGPRREEAYPRLNIRPAFLQDLR